MHATYFGQVNVQVMQYKLISTVAVTILPQIRYVMGGICAVVVCRSCHGHASAMDLYDPVLIASGQATLTDRCDHVITFATD